MSNSTSEFDYTVILCTAVVFGLPLALLIPGFSIWDVVPKIRVQRFHLLSQHLTWSVLNGAVIITVVVLFCLYLEFRKRILDAMTEEVFAVRQATIRTMEAENDRQAATIRACAELLDASSDHYENLVLLYDELRQRDRRRDHPPIIELESNIQVDTWIALSRRSRLPRVFLHSHLAAREDQAVAKINKTVIEISICAGLLLSPAAAR
ncbi:hypothetical protein RR46_04657 [Papilio xuthus]|uniref:Uncharacterized protein n=1 Tax=Papilio xuthus TaxID=66420 RepID=A0A194Q119_PAPXU|nr:hypothetical protein RR46_04657 [Papilio xuthus]